MFGRLHVSRSVVARVCLVAALSAGGTGCAAGMSRLKSGIAGTPGSMSMPNLLRMSKAEALSTLKLAGHHGDVTWSDQLCGSVVDGQIVEKDDICQQTPAAGQQLDQGAPVHLLAQPEDPRHGHVGESNEWHLMPAVVGLPLAKAQVAMREAGFTDERTHVDTATEAGCKPGIVCRTYPVALERAGQHGDRYLTVGADPTRPPPPPRARPDEPTAHEDDDASAPPPPPPPPKPDSYF